MEAHAGTIVVGRGPTRSRRRRIAGLRERLRQRRIDRAARAHSLRVNGARAPFVPGSEHTHMLRTKGF
jgi:hypothetical protein